MSEKEKIIEDFTAYSQPVKAETWQRYGMDLVLGRRDGPYIWDIDGGELRINPHINGGTYNLGHHNPEIIATLKEALDDLELDIGNGHLISQYRAQTDEDRLHQVMFNLVCNAIKFTDSGGGPDFCRTNRFNGSGNRRRQRDRYSAGASQLDFSSI